jgi:hypothetical protein
MDSLALEDGTVGSPETSVLNQLTGHNNSESRKIQFNRGGRIDLARKYIIICK